jgi:hypothetical protein
MSSIAGRLITPKVEPKVKVTYDKRSKLLRYGKGNQYPQFIEDRIERSPMASRCSEIFKDFLQGDGFADENLNRLVINKDGEDMEEILELIAEDYSKHKGFALRFVYNIFLEITQIYHVPFKDCRYGLPDKYGYVSMIAVNDNWENDTQKKASRKTEIQYVPVFNPKKEVVQAQIDQAGSIRQYKGQILYCTPHKNKYPKAHIDPVLEDVDTDARVSISKNMNTHNNFMASGIIIDPNNYEVDEKGVSKQQNDFCDEIEKFQGAENTGALLYFHLPGLTPEEANKLNLFQPTQVQNLDRIFEFTEQSSENRIRRELMVPKPLLSEFDGNSLSQSAAILRESVSVYNLLTSNHRAKIEKALQKLQKKCPLLEGYDLKILEKYGKLQTAVSEPSGFQGEGGDT